MAASNPYDRRHDGGVRTTDRGMVAGTPMFARGAPFELALASEDLDAMARSAYARGAREEAERRMAEHAEDRLAAQRRAWDEGRRAGRAAALRELDVRVLARARKHHDAGRDVLERVSVDARKVTKAELERALDAAVDVIAEILSNYTAALAADDFVASVP